jgi:hypothetical protein
MKTSRILSILVVIFTVLVMVESKKSRKDDKANTSSREMTTSEGFTVCAIAFGLFKFLMILDPLGIAKL